MTATDAMREPPQSADAERGVLGAVLRDPDCRDRVFARLDAADFFLDPHRRLFAALARLHAAGRGFDLVAAFEAVRAAGDDRDVTAADLADLHEAVPTAAHADLHARIVREKAARRALARLGTELVRAAHDQPDRPAADLLAECEQQVFALADRGRGASEPVPVGVAVREALDAIDRRQQAGGQLPGITSGFVDLDARTGGWRPGLIYLAARPGVGKTALALSFARAAAGAGTPVLFVSLEMGRQDLAERLLSMSGGVGLSAIRGSKRMPDGMAAALVRAADGFGPATSILIADDPRQKPATVAALARRAVRTHRVGMVIVDYLQLMEPENPRDSREQQVSLMSRRMKQLSRQLDVPVICLAQLNRQIESRGGDGRPKLSDLRDSGQMEQDADAVLLLWREQAVEASDVWTIGLDIAKCRNGPTGELRLVYRRPVVRFENHAPGW